MSCLRIGDDVAMNVGYAYGSDSSAEQTCQLSRDELPSDSAEKGLALYCKPVILYHNIQERAKQNASFLRRGLRYKIHAKQRKRIRITISLSRNTNDELQAQNIFPLYALVARSISDVLVEGHSPLYRFNQACLLTSFNESGSSKHSKATFIIPDLTTLATTRAILEQDCRLVFCSQKFNDMCGNFKGLEYHLLSSHDLFNFEFKISEKHQAVNVRPKHHTRTAQLFPEAAVDPRHGTFSYFSKYKKYGRLMASTEMTVPSKATEIVSSEIIEVVKPGQLVSMGSKSLEYAQDDIEDHVQKDNGISVPDVSVVPDDSLHGGSLSPPKVLQFERLGSYMFINLTPENLPFSQWPEILSDHDSEGEIDDDVVDLEERVVLDTYSDIEKDEKRIMHMWNSFVWRQRVLADVHIPWACKAFSELHGQLFVQTPSLRWCWRLLMIKFWNHNLLDARTMDTCNRILDDIKDKSVNVK